jgi:hypothetical protein
LRLGCGCLTLVLLTASLLAAPATAQQLSGTVVGANGTPRAGVVVDVMGPRKLVTRTDQAGEFAVDLPTGSYTVRMRVDGRRQEFRVRVGQADGRRTFRLSW